MDKIAFIDLVKYEKIDYRICRVLPEPFGRYAFNFKELSRRAQKERPSGKSVFICAAIKSMVKQDSRYVLTALDVVAAEEKHALVSIFGLAGLVLCFIGQSDDGIELLRKSCGLEPSTRFTLTLAAELESVGKCQESLELCYQVLGDEPDNLEAKRILAINHLNQNQLAPSKQLISEVLAANPKDKKARRILGRILFDEGNYDLAISEYKKALSLFDYNPYVFYFLSQCYFKMGQLTKSRKYITKIRDEVFRIDPYFRDNEHTIREFMANLHRPD